MILRLDHVAFAVWDMRAAASLRREALGGGYRQGGTEYRGFNFLQFAWPEGSRVELLSPTNDELSGPRLLVQLAQSSLSVVEQDELWRREPLGSVLEVAAI